MNMEDVIYIDLLEAMPSLAKIVPDVQNAPVRTFFIFHPRRSEATVLSEEDLTEKFVFLSKRLRMEAIYFSAFGISARAIGKLLLLQSQTLLKLDMSSLSVRGSRNDLEYFGAGLVQCLKLRSIIMNARQVYGGENTSLFLTSIASALAKIEALESVHLYRLCEMQSFMYEQALAVFCQTNLGTDKLLQFSTNSLSQHTVQALCGATSKLGKLSLGLDGVIHAIALLESIEHNAVLNQMELSIGCKDKDERHYPHAWSQPIEHIQYLKTLHINLGSGGSLDWALQSVGAVVSGLAGNACIEDMSFKVSVVGPAKDNLRGLIENSCSKNFQALEKSLATTNFALKFLRVLFWYNSCPYPIMDEKSLLWLRFNRAGRKQLMDNPLDRDVWFKTLVGQRDDVPFTFQIMSSNPAIFFEPPTTPSGLAKRGTLRAPNAAVEGPLRKKQCS